MRRARIRSVGSYVPPKVVKNQDLEAIMETSDEWILKRTGIAERRWVDPFKQCTSDLALEASKEALDKAKLKPTDIDMIVFATLSPDHDFPGTGVFLQDKLGVPGIAALDIRQQCTGFIYGISIADQFIRSGMYEKVLVVGAEVHSTGLDKTTRGRDVSVLFGDGAGAVVIEACEVTDPKKDRHIIATRLHADGSHAKELWMPAPGSAMHSANRVDIAMLEEGKHYPEMNGKKVFVHAVKRMGETLLDCLQAERYGINDVDRYFFHQANLRINEAVADQLKIESERVFNTIQKYGNTTAATIPLGMNDAISEDKLKEGDLIALAAFGSGFTWGSALVRF